MATAPFQLWIETAPIQSAVRVSSTVTITTSSPHGITTGGYVQIETTTGAAGTSMVGVYQATVTSGTTFTYTAAGSAGTAVVTAAALSYDLLTPLVDYAAANRQAAIYVIPDSITMSATGDGTGSSMSFSVAQDDTPADGPWFTLIPDEARVRLVKANTGTTPATDKSDLLFVSSVRAITAQLNGSGQGTIADVELVDPTAQLDRIVVYGARRSARFILPGGAVRSSNVVTFTTTSLHGLAVGDPIRIQGVNGGGGTSFNSNFKVATVPTTTTFTVAQTGSDATGNTATTPTAAAFVAKSKQVITYTVPSNHGFLARDRVKISGVSHTNANVQSLLNGYFAIIAVGATEIQVRLPAILSSITGTFTVSGATITPYGSISDGSLDPLYRMNVRAGDTDVVTVVKILNGVAAYKFEDYALQRIISTSDTSAIIGTTSTLARIERQMPPDTFRSMLDTVVEAFQAVDSKPRRYWVNTSGQLAFQVVDTTAKPAYANAPYKIITSGAGTPNTTTNAATLAAANIELMYDHETTKNVVVSVPNPTATADDIFYRSYTEAGYTLRKNAPTFDALLDLPAASGNGVSVNQSVEDAASQYFLERREPVLSAKFDLTGAGTASFNNLGFSAGYALLNLGTISSASRTASTVTVTMATAHGLATGTTVILAGITGTAGTTMNGTYTVTVTTTTAFTYTSAGTAGSGTVTLATAFGAKLVSKWEPGQWVDVAAPELGLSGLYRVEQVDLEFEPGSFTQRLGITINRTPTRSLTALLQKRGRN